MESFELNIYVADIETLREAFLFMAYFPKEDKWMSFRVNKWNNDIDAFIRFTETYKDYYMVSFNGLRFDSQVVEWIIRNHESWNDFTNLEICAKIHQKAQDTIDDANYEIFPAYKEDQLTLKQIDLFTIWHFNNEARRTSLKALEYAMDMENIEEMPIDHRKIGLTDEDLLNIDKYCENDVMATYQFYLITRGETNMKIYKGEDKIADRLAMEKEFGLKCLNWDDVKIGAEWNKLDYINLTGRNEKDLKPRQLKHFYGKRFKQFFPKCLKFQTPEIQQFVKELGETYVINEKQEFKFDFSQILKK